MPTEIIETSMVGDITIVHTVKPKKSMSEMHEKCLILTKRMKAFRKTLTSACGFCQKLQTDELVCAKCKVAAYCSKEVRLRKPTHKLVCRESKAAAKLKLVHTFAASPLILSMLTDTFSLAFDFHNKIILDRPLIMQCDLVVDAADLSIIFSLTSGKQTPDDYPDGVEGMIQLKTFIPLDPTVAIDAGRRKIWEQARLRMTHWARTRRD
ncbi:hypothetical protein HYPSUDRAFT_198876 [Hypholoma sublateritium FD-334 SS-4]|uniref:MYND-type domain-containing protein n=1 Tax=Hypholoma sublateritium (strain FD-334 SS-4) TaxID=945553 RepID=A0A0D2PDH9_HYPSF|nr:hypothetical protein HYPSUDRAFT_198876 [Hypholoma sublateritium FD-334 SS-4]